MDWNKLVQEAKRGNGRRIQSGLRQHIREILAEVPESVRGKLQGQSVGIWCQVLKAVLVARYEVHAKDRLLYSKIRGNLLQWPSEFEVDEDNNVRYLKW